MSSIVRLGAAALLIAAAASADPAITSVQNAAIFVSTFPTPGNVAQGSFFAIKGTGLGPDAGVLATSLPLPAQLPDGSGPTVAVTSGSTTVAAFLYYAQANQINAILPSSTPVGAATVTVTYNGKTSPPAKFNVVRSAFGMFTINAQGNGQGSARLYPSFQQNFLTAPAPPGSVMLLFGTGLGPVSVPDNDVPGAVGPSVNVTVNVGGKPATVLYAGRAPQFPAEDQINIQLAPDTPTGCYVPAVVTVDGIPSNDFVLPIGTGNSCTHPLGLTPDAEAKLDAFQTVNVGVFAAIRGAASGIVADGAGGVFANADASAVFNIYTVVLNNFNVLGFPVATNNCVVFDELLPAPGLNLPAFTPILGLKELKSSAFLTLSGPGNTSRNIGPGDNGGYLLLNLIGPASPAILGPGTWTLSGTAGPDVNAFSTSTEFPQNLTWTNSGNLATPPRSDITITWTGGGTSVQPNVYISGNSTVLNSADPSKNRGKSFACQAPASAGKFVIPAAITQQLPVPSNSSESAVGSLGLATGGGQPFTATLANGKTTDGGFFGFGEAFVQSVTWGK